MARNLCTSSCCGNTVRISDLAGKPIEFRRYAHYPPKIGTRWDCPNCGTSYFVIWRATESGFWLDLSYYESYNDEHNYDYDKMGEIIGIKHTLTPSSRLKNCFISNANEIIAEWEKQNRGDLLIDSTPQYCVTDNCEDVQLDI